MAEFDEAAVRAWLGMVPGLTVAQRAAAAAEMAEDEPEVEQKFEPEPEVEPEVEPEPELEPTGGSGAWTFNEYAYGGSYSSAKMGEIRDVQATIASGVVAVKVGPEEHLAVFYQSDMVGWPEDQQQYKLILRHGTKGFKLQGGRGRWSPPVHSVLGITNEIYRGAWK
jgi:hypothetical protein